MWSSGITFLTKDFLSLTGKLLVVKSSSPIHCGFVKNHQAVGTDGRKWGFPVRLQTPLTQTWVSELNWAKGPFSFLRVPWGNRKQGWRFPGKEEGLCDARHWARALLLSVNASAVYFAGAFQSQAPSHVLPHFTITPWNWWSAGQGTAAPGGQVRSPGLFSGQASYTCSSPAGVAAPKGEVSGWCEQAFPQKPESQRAQPRGEGRAGGQWPLMGPAL